MTASTPAHRLMPGQRVRIEGPGVVTGVLDEDRATVEVRWQPDGERKEVTSAIPREHHVKHAA